MAQTSVNARLVGMLVVNLPRDVVRKMVVLRRVARLPVVPRTFRIQRVHPAQFFYPLAKGVLFSHSLFYCKGALARRSLNELGP